ncbi:MAG: enoyl-CoA hydratase/isomerase family protein [Desulfosalsimonadaceae bacterium]
MIESYVEDDIAIVKLNNPPSNSINTQTLEQLGQIVRSADSGASPKGLVITGEGRFFSSGFDLPIFYGFEDLDAAERFFDFEESVLLSLFTCRKPVVSAINGHAAAAGLIYSMAADYRIVKEHPKIKIGMSEIKIGLPLTIAQHEVMRFGLDGNMRFRDVMFAGEMMDVYKAREMALVDELVAEDALLDRAKQMVSACIDTPNRPFMRMKELLRMDTARRIQQKLDKENWREELNCFFKDEVRRTLKFVQESMQ